MEAITLIDALMCELDPYTVSPKVCIKALMDNGVSDHSVSYDPDKDKVVVADRKSTRLNSSHRL